MRRLYVDTRHGQIHVRVRGAANAPALLLIHWTPFSGRMWEPVAPWLAQAGWRVIAPDLLGYGRSDPRPEAWSVEGWADSCAEVLDALGVTRCALAGGHMGAAVALEVALRHPERMEAVVLDGCPLMTPELRAAFAGLAESPPPGSARIVVERVEGLLREYVPGWEPEGDALKQFWPALADYLATGFASSAPVAAAYDMAARLPMLRAPVLLLGAEHDSLAGTFERAGALLGGAARHMFEGDHPIHFPDWAREWAGVVLSFLSSAPRGRG